MFAAICAEGGVKGIGSRTQDLRGWGWGNRGGFAQPHTLCEKTVVATKLRVSYKALSLSANHHIPAIGGGGGRRRREGCICNVM